jgi:hypothetical protein
VKFNINDTVRVRLTDYGRAVLRDDWQFTTDVYYASPKSRAIRGEYKPPKEDAHGWSEWQLWALMEAFGEYTGQGFSLSFETEIEIVGARGAKAEADLAQRTAERDEARRDLCVSVAIDRLCETHALISYGESRRIAREIAAERGWNCFDAKEGQR